MIISHKKKFIFFACGRTGTTSIENALSQYHDAKDLVCQIENILHGKRKEYSKPFNPKHVRPSMVKALMPSEEWNSYFKFVFVRNPWDWILSNYFYNYKHLTSSLNKFEVVHLNVIWNLLKFFDHTDDSTGYYQSSFVADNNETMVDYIGKFESLQEDFNHVCHRIGIAPVKLKATNQTIHPPYRTIYSTPAKEHAEKLLATDIDRFGYEF